MRSLALGKTARACREGEPYGGVHMTRLVQLIYKTIPAQRAVLAATKPASEPAVSDTAAEAAASLTVMPNSSSIIATTLMAQLKGRDAPLNDHISAAAIPVHWQFL
jgi:hypothetical protein